MAKTRMMITLDRPITEENPFKICFVCLGNICRSPTAEGIMQHWVKEKSLQSYFEIDSAGTSAYHAGENANRHSQRVANDNGVHLRSRSRRFTSDDLTYFDLILAMDDQNMAAIRSMHEDHAPTARIMRLREFDSMPENGQVPDPYDGGPQGFEHVFEVIERSCRHLLDELEHYIEE